MSESALVSIIVPVYNVGGYITRCLDSIASQSYKNIEVILVDDGSTDSSGAICDEFGRKDSRFKVIHQENQWLARARNAGLAVAEGEFLYFVDADDAVHPLLIERAMRVYRETGCDYVICGHRREFDLPGDFGVDVLPDAPLVEEKSANTVLERMILECDEDNVYGVAWNKLIPASLASGLEFADIYANEDVPFTIRLALRSSKVSVIKEPLYHYTLRSSSIMGSSWNKWALNNLRMRFLCLDYLPQEDTFIRGLALNRLYTKIFARKVDLLGTDYERECMVVSKDIIKKTWKEFIHHPGINFRLKVFFTFARLNPWVPRLMSKTIGNKRNDGTR
ncbi:MAG: glycosyltransferase [Bacteroidales bacterium]|nr:glycosyltransferase [Bacteroidales bacterium]